MAQIPDAELQIEIGEIKPQKWEYLTYFLGELDNPKHDDTLNNWGSLGWELVTVLVTRGVGCTAYFKRPIWSD